MGLTGEVRIRAREREREREERSQPPPPGEDEKEALLATCSFPGNPGTAQDPAGENPLFANLAGKGRQMPAHTPAPAAGERTFPLSHRRHGFLFGLNPD